MTNVLRFPRRRPRNLGKGWGSRTHINAVAGTLIKQGYPANQAADGAATIIAACSDSKPDAA